MPQPEIRHRIDKKKSRARRQIGGCWSTRAFCCLEASGTPPELAAARLSAINERWRAIQQLAMEIWKGEGRNREAAQRALLDRAKGCLMARNGQYGES
ncbi:class I fructose-bisphosphate aldolase [Chlorobium sp. N1]|uniref:class I fructose-bisphosphate aldolase n=1 Tax=Chlorobium sp. N1 TaxID=2491138 RepID=UPI00325B441C